MKAKPLVLTVMCRRRLGDHGFQVIGRKYLDAVRLAGCVPLPLADAQDLDALLPLADGVLLTGSPSNVHPRHFGEDVLDAALPLDAARDEATLGLIPHAIELGLPLLAICRGLQEVNVALGGSLHQAVQQQPGMADHRSHDEDPVDTAYGPRHAVQVEPGGLLADLLPGRETFDVNSLHGQGVRRLAPGLRIEARAPDGLVEAFSITASPTFALCVQWHPEWQAETNPVSMALLRAFGEACRLVRDARP